MGKVVVSSEDEMEEDVKETELQVVQEGNNKKMRSAGGGEAPAATVAVAGTSSSSVVGWERFLPKMVLRVLLVEADDSTRQIIAALLRKCSYRVAAVGDGLKAWELLKARPQNIDLILTEVELPSISGYALLTLIMEHDDCKKIPVIMMSSQDSISTVYKCMLRGAADFLVKPVRKNELKNLWQHFWRKQASSSVGVEPPDESVAQQKVEATSENKANSNYSSGSMACIRSNRECIEKGSDAQSSCTKPESNSEETDIDQDRGLAQTIIPKHFSNDIRIPTQEECHQERRKIQGHNNDTRANVLTGLEEVDVNGGQNSENKIENSSREAIDLIGAFDNYGKGTFGISALNASTSKFDSLPHLDLSLRRCNPSGHVNQVYDEHGLNHSDSSAFHRYIDKRLRVSPSTCSQQKDNEPISDKKLSCHTPDHISDPHGPTLSSQKHVSVATVQPGTSQIAFPYPLQKESSLPIPVKGVRFENATNAYESIMPALYHAQPGLSPLPSPGTACTAGTANHSESFHQMNKFCPSDHPPLSSQQLHNLMDQTLDDAIDPSDDKHDQKSEDLEDGGNLSPANDQSANSSFCNVNLSHHYSTGYGINSKINEISVVKATSECGNDQESFNVYEGSSHRSIQREAALTKFRLKRKDRCFEKKVRYESRKKLAEQRPRVKGQFVRQVPSNPHPG